MSLFAKIVTGVFGRKADKDIKILTPYIDLINSVYESLSTLTDKELIKKFNSIKMEAENISKDIISDPKSKVMDNESLSDVINKAEQEYLDSKMVEVFAIIKDACRRINTTEFVVMKQKMVWEMVPFDVQLIGGVALHQGKVAEMKTGEGKTLVSTMPIILNALLGKGVHVVTVNDYLAERDSQWMGLLYNFLGLSVGCILNQMNNHERKEMYLKDITYGTNSQFGFDYLRDNMSIRIEDQVQRGHAYAIVDEVDSVLVDEARTPLIISGSVDAPTNQQYNEWRNSISNIIKKQNLLINNLIAEAEKLLHTNEAEAAKNLLIASRGAPKNKRLMKIFQKKGTQQLVHKVESEFIRDKKMHEIDEQLYFSIDERAHVIDLSEMGRNFLSSENPENFIIPDLGELFHEIENLNIEDKAKILQKKEEAQALHMDRSDRIHAINQLLRAYSLYEKDIEYIVQEGKVLIVDEHTGRVLHGRRFSDGLHQALEAKEKVIIEKETQTMATITIQNYFRMYSKLAGMTGTAVTEAQELMEIYKLDVVEIPTNKTIVRIDSDDLVYRSKREKYTAVIQKIQDLYHKGQPVLVGTTSVEESETLGRMLKRAKLPHNVLNAKQHQKEAEVIIRAGQKSAVTISTNMAGRGTDIKLGDGVKELGGLFILGTGRHESRRIDLQLRGRAGRQGDSGESIFFLSLEDDLMRLFGSDRIAKVMDKMGIEEGEVISHSMVTNSIERAQKKVEGRNFGIRKHLLEYDDVMNQQREIVYNRRNHALHGSSIKHELNEIINEFLDNIFDLYCNYTKNIQDWKWDELSSEILNIFSLDIKSNENISSEEDLKQVIIEGADAILSHKKQTVNEEIFEQFQKWVIFKTIDENWREHLAAMDQLREGIGLRAYGQKNPLIEYKQEGFAMFAEMMVETNRETLKRIFRSNIQQVDQKITKSKPLAKNIKMKHDESPNLAFTSNPRVGQSSAANQLSVNNQNQRQPISVAEKIGRNDPCPCGSEKKYKKCCGA